MKKTNLKRTILWRYITIVFTVLIADALVILGGSFLASSILTDEYLKTSIYVQQEQVGSSLDQIVYETLATYARIFTTDNLDELSDSSDIDASYDELISQAHINTMIYAGVVTEYQGYELSSDENLPTPLAVDQERVINSENWINYLRTSPSQNGEELYLIFGKKVINPLQPDVPVATTFFYVHHALVADIITNITASTGFSFLMDSEHYIIASQQQDSAGTYLYSPNDYPIKNDAHHEIIQIDGKREVIAITPLSEITSSYGFNWHLVSVQPYQVLFSELQSMQTLIFITAFIVLLFSVGLSIIMTRRLVSPIKKLSQKITGYDPSLPPSFTAITVEDDEIAQLERSYDEMITRIYSLMEKNREDAEYQRKLELDSLQEQINPHFLYNTLDTIAWMAKIKKEPDIEKLVLALAKFFRISLHRGDKFITVEEEVELIQHFMAIELIRFPDKFSVTYNLSEEVKPYKTLKILLQPIVENSIKHGISSLERMGHIEINAYLDKKDVVYEIIDDGIGFEPKEDLFKRKEKTALHKGGYGLYNVNERIKLEYGNGYGLKVKSTVGKGTKITIRIAARL